MVIAKMKMLVSIYLALQKSLANFGLLYGLEPHDENMIYSSYDVVLSRT